MEASSFSLARLLDLQAHDLAAERVELGGHGVHLGADGGAGLVEEVDGLVGEEAVLDVAVGEDGGVDEGGVLDSDVVVGLEALLEAAEDADGVLDGGRGDHDGLEAALEGFVLFHVEAVLGEGGGADAVELAAREHGFEHVARVAGALGFAGADDGVDLVDEEDDAPLAGLDFLEDGLEALLEVAAVFGAGHEGGQVEGEDGAVLEAFGDVAADDALGEAFDDGGLADAGLADEHGVVLGLAREDADDVADLGVAADDGVELAFAGEFDEIRAVFLERLVAFLGVFAGDALVAADFLEGGQEVVLTQPQVAQQFHAPGHRQEDVLDGDVGVAHLLGAVEGLHQRLLQGGGDVDLVGLHRAGDARQAVHRLGHAGAGHLHGDAAFLKQACGQPFLLGQQRPEHVFGLHRLLLAADALLLRRGQGLAQTFRHLVHVHG